MRILFSLLIVFCSGTTVAAQSKPDTIFLENLLKQHPQWFQHLLDYPDSFNVQIVYTRIDRDKKNKPHFTEYQYRLNKDHYFYPASTVKMPAAFLALEKLNRLKIPGLSKSSTMITDSSADGQDVVYTHPLAEDGRPSIEHYIKQIFLVSDNDAFNRLYEFLGQEYIQRELKKKAYPDVQIRHRLNVYRTQEQNRQTNPVSFYDTSGQLLYEQPGFYSNAVFPQRVSLQGNGYYSGGKLIQQPFSFSEKNRVYLEDQHHILQSVLFPEAVSKKRRFQLSDDDYAFIKHWMSAYPKESRYPYYDSSEYYDTYCKFMFYGSEKKTVHPDIRIFNKVGDAYGFLTDISYIVDFANGVEFMVSATISCNTDGIFNDDHYDYDRIGYPFLKHLGQALYDYELKRTKKHMPDLTEFRMVY
jgi:hypothetical protein